MRKICGLWLVLTLTVLLAGCEPQVSLFPLFTREDTLFEKQLVGEWKFWGGTELKAGEKPGLIVFSVGKEKNSYDVKISDVDEGKTMVSEARLVGLSSYLFIDFGTPDLDKMPQTPYPAVEGHVFGRLTLEKEKARIDLLSDDWVKARVRAGNLPLAFQEVPEPLLAADTPELRKFVTEHAEDQKAFSETFTLVRKN